MKILFYLPLARGWMLENVIAPMIAKLSALADVHVMLPSTWMEKYSDASSSPSMAWSRDVEWHWLDSDRSGLDALDTEGPSPEILAAVRAIGPDHCLCRSADPSLPGRLPGQVRYIMEASAPPFFLPKHWISLQPQIFDHGLIPDLPAKDRAALTELIAADWAEIERSHPRDPSWRARHGLPPDRRIVAVPLEYDHPDNLFSVHRRLRPNPVLVAALADRARAPLFLAITDHPLNERFVDNRDLIETIDARPDMARLLSPGTVAGGITTSLAQHADGMIVGDSKSFAAAAFFGTPLLRLSKFASGPWLRAYSDLDRFTEDLAAGEGAAARRDEAMLWFAFYLANEVFAPRDADLSGAELRARIERPVDPARWPDAFARVRRLQTGRSDPPPTGLETGA
jgi:hypothetical protein